MKNAKFPFFIFKTIDILRNYTGLNPYILRMKRDVIDLQKTSLLTEYAIEYIITNQFQEPKSIGKTLNITDWFGDSLKDKYQIEFSPRKLQILIFLGETRGTYHCMVKYRVNMNPMEMFIPKKALMGNFLIDDYHTVQVDFDRYDMLASLKDPNRKIKAHQKEAVQFLLARKKCILADDMGVGKSMELTIAALEGNFDSILIICPASLKTNWKKELMWYVPEKDITIIESFNGKTKSELEKHLGYGEGKSGLSTEDLKKEAMEKGKIVFERDANGDGEVVCFSKNEGIFVRIFEGKTTEINDFAYVLKEIMGYIFHERHLILTKKGIQRIIL